MSSSRTRTSALDGLRGLALLLVMASHAGAPVFGGHLIMLTLSGFLLTSQLLKEMDRTDRVRLRVFYSRRAWRLLPALAVMLIGVNLLVAFVIPDAAEGLRRDSLYALMGLSNWAQVWQSTPSPLLTHLWTLAIQVQVLMIWPVGMLLLKHLSRHALLWVCLAGAVCVSLIRARMVLSGASMGFVYVATYTRIDGVFLGSALGAALSVPPYKRWVMWGQTHHLLMSVISVSVLVVMGVCLMFYPLRSSLTYLVSMPLVSLCTVMLMAFCLLPQKTWIVRVFEHRALVSLGAISYGAYLWHYPIVILLLAAHIEHAGLIGVICGLVLGALSYRLIEVPMRGRR